MAGFHLRALQRDLCRRLLQDRVQVQPPFVAYIVVSFICVGLGEALHHFPGLEALNAFGTDFLPLQLALLALGILAYALITWLSFRRACRSFEKIDL